MGFISDTEVLRVLRGFNPWWPTGLVPDSLARPVKRLAYYEAGAWLKEERLHRAIVLCGARRVGKTTILYQLAQQQIEQGRPANRVLYVSFDHPMLKLTPLQQVIDIFTNNVAAGRENLFLLLDEIHYAGDWSLWLKRLVDENPTVSIVATGSASAEIGAGGVESGVGRWLEVKVPTLSFFEYARLKKIESPDLDSSVKPTALPRLSAVDRNEVLTKVQHLEPHFHKFLLSGGFPETAQMDDLAMAQRLLRDDVVDRVLKRDMASLYNVSNVLDLERLFIYLCLNSGGLFVRDTLAKEMGVAWSTVSNYLRYLELANLAYRLDPITSTGKKALKPRPKVYVADAALRNAVLLRGSEVLENNDETGLIVETAVIKHLHAFYYADRPETGYWRGEKDKEIDFVVRRPGSYEILVEVKYRSDPVLTKDSGLYQYPAGGDYTRRLVITKAATDFGPIGPVQGGVQPFAVPAFAFLYLLGHAEHQGYLSRMA